MIGCRPCVWPQAALLAVLLPAGTLAADVPGPTVARLVATCDRAQAQDNRGPEAAACEWFSAPCACKLSRTGQTSEPWCIPPGDAVATTVAKVVAALRHRPDQGAPAAPVVAEILARLYPCPPSSQP